MAEPSKINVRAALQALRGFIKQQLLRLQFLEPSLLVKLEGINIRFAQFDSDKKLTIPELKILKNDIEQAIRGLQNSLKDNTKLSENQRNEVRTAIVELEAKAKIIDQAITEMEAKQPQESAKVQQNKLRAAEENDRARLLSPRERTATAEPRILTSSIEIRLGESPLDVKIELVTRIAERPTEQRTMRPINFELLRGLIEARIIKILQADVQSLREQTGMTPTLANIIKILTASWINDEIVAPMASALSTSQTKSQPQILEIVKDKAPQPKVKAEDKTAEKISVRITPQAESAERQEALLVSVNLELSEAELPAMLSQLVRSDRTALVPVLLQTASQLIMTQALPKTDIIASTVNAIAQSIPENRFDQRKLIQTLIAQLAQPITAEKENATIKLEIVKAILERLPVSTVLPILIDLSRRTSEPETMRLIDALTVGLAATKSGQTFIISQLAKSPEPAPLLNSPIGQTVILKVASALIEEAKALPANRQQIKDRLLTIAQPLIAANPQLATGITHNPILAKAFLEIIGKAAATPESETITIGKARPKKGVVRALKAALYSPYRSHSTTANQATQAKQIAKQIISEGRVKEQFKAWQAITEAAKQNQILVPQVVLNQMVLNVSGLPISASTSAISLASALQLPPESAANTMMHRITKVLEAQIAQGITSKDPAIWSKVFTLSAQAFLYGLVMRLSRGSIAQVDEVIKVMKKTQRLAAVVDNIERGEIETATEAIAFEVLSLELSQINEQQYEPAA